MQHECRITVLETKCFPDLQEKYLIERIDIPESDEEREWLAKQSFRNTAEDAYTG